MAELLQKDVERGYETVRSVAGDRKDREAFLENVVGFYGSYESMRDNRQGY